MEKTESIDYTSRPLKQKVISASTWTVLEYFTNEALRGCSSLIITRFLLPEMFGLMQLVTVFSLGLSMISDLGIRVNIIQHKRGSEPDFLHTAWLVQVIRGVVVWILALFLSRPFSEFYGYPELKVIIPVACLSTVIYGFSSVNIYVYEKHLQMRIVSLIRIFASIVSFAVMIVITWQFQTIWALVSYGLVYQSIISLFSHFIPGEPLRLKFNKNYFYDIVNFGKWLILSSILWFFLRQMDKLYLGKVVSAEQLGIYGIAAALSMVFLQFVIKYNSSVSLPLYRLLMDESLAIRRQGIWKVRMTMLLIFIPPLLILTVWGEEIIGWIYPSNFHDAGKILKILALGSAISLIPHTIGPILLAAGNSFRPTVVIFSRIVVLFLLMNLGYYYYGFYGVIYGIAFSEICVYPIFVLCIFQYGVWMPITDFAFFFLCASIGKIAEVI